MIQGIEQPNIIQINSCLRLKKFDGYYDFAYQWYLDKETVRLVDGEDATVYDMERLHRMYDCLNNQGELYFIEIKELNKYIPIGDVTFWQEDMPIVIGDKSYRNCGIGLLVIKTLIKRAINIGYKTIYVNEIYDYNESSKAVFIKAGFKEYKKTELGSAYLLNLENYK